MRHLGLFVWFTFAALSTFAQQVDSVDNLVLTIPADWQMTRQSTFTELKYFDKKRKTFCQVVVYSAIESSGDKKGDFQNEWRDLVEQNFTVFTLAEPVTIKSRSGNEIKRLGAKAVGKDGNNYYVQLNVYDCGSTNQSVVVVSGNLKQLHGYDSLWQSLITEVKKSRDVASMMNFPGKTVTDPSVIGQWAKSSGSPPQYRNGTLVNLVNSGYHKGQYHFKDDGTYTFHSESMFSSNDFGLVDESGSYAISKEKIVLHPTKALLKKVDAQGVVKKQDSLPLAKRTYNWKLHYFEGIGENNLVLSGVSENIVDGGFAANASFPNSFLYSKEFKPEWRFK